MVELLIAIAIMSLMAGALGALAHAVQMSSEYSNGHMMATQHARVVLERIERCVNQATANADFPGAAVFATSVGTWRFPDTLVVWHPSGSPANPSGLPLFRELVVFCPNPTSPNQLLEITDPTDARPVPPLSDTVAWNAALDALRTSGTSRKVVLTDLMRASTVSGTSDSKQRGAVRFEIERRPSSSEWASYLSGTMAWEDLAWVQGVRGPRTGLSQTWARMELQLLPGHRAENDSNGQQAIPFQGSAAVYFTLSR